MSSLTFVHHNINKSFCGICLKLSWICVDVPSGLGLVDIPVEPCPTSQEAYHLLNRSFSCGFKCVNVDVLLPFSTMLSKCESDPFWGNYPVNY